MSSLSETFIVKAKKIYGDRYDYSEITYMNAFTPINIKCPKHGYFTVTTTKHLSRGRE